MSIQTEAEFLPYDGNEPFLFISYARKNWNETVGPALNQLNRAGFRIWYDNGIPPGAPFVDMIAHRIRDCALFVAFLSEEYSDSRYCMSELHFAVYKQKKSIFPVRISEGISLSLQIQLMLGRFNSLQLKSSIEIPSFVEHMEKKWSQCRIIKPDPPSKPSDVVMPDGLTMHVDGGIQWAVVEETLVIQPVPSSDGIMPDHALSPLENCGDTPWKEERTALTSVSIADGVTRIGEFAFYGCTDLQKVTIPDSVRAIGAYAFYRCHQLMSVESLQGVRDIGHHAFADCSRLSSLKLPKNVEIIGEYAFSRCTGLKELSFEGSVKDLGRSAFDSCERLARVSLPNGMEVIEENVFYNCRKLTDIHIPEGVREIKRGAFEKCAALSSIQLPSSICRIADWAFWDCETLSRIRVPKDVVMEKNAVRRPDVMVEFFLRS